MSGVADLLINAPVVTHSDVWGGIPTPLEQLGHTKPPKLVLAMVPLRLRAWTAELASRMAVPLEALVIPALVSIGAVLGRKFLIQPYGHDWNWAETLNVWGCLVAEPGVILKTPTMNAALAPLYTLEKSLFDVYQAEFSTYEVELETWEKAKSGERGEKPKRPIQKSIIVDDITVEALATTLEGNPNGVLVAKDEILNLIKAWEQPAKAADRTFYMKGWGGQTPHVVRRQSRISQHIPAVCISMYGTVQPGPLSSYVNQAVSGGEGADGLLERFQLLTMPEPVAWVGMPESPSDPLAVDEYHRLITDLWELEGSAIGAVKVEHGPYRLVFDVEAQTLFTAWRDDLEQRVRASDLPSIMKSVLSKQRGLIPRLAALIHLSSGGVNPIESGSLKLAIAWGQFLEKHAQYIFSTVRDGGSTATRALADKIMAGKLKDSFKLRDFQRKEWAGLNTTVLREAALQGLIDVHWIRLGEDKKTYSIHPDILKGVKP